MATEEKILQDVISEVEESGKQEKKEPEVQKILEEESRKEETLADQENRGIIGMREKWSNSILFLIQLIVIFDMVLVFAYGMGYWTFSDTKVAIAIITDNFLKIIVLGLIITKSIFTKIFH